MRFFFDTEFHEDKHGVELISLAFVKENGEEYYAINKDYDQNRATDWLKHNVIARLELVKTEQPLYRSLSNIKKDLVDFCHDMDEVWGYCAAYDWFLVARIMGGMLQKPAEWPFQPFDIEQARHEKGMWMQQLPPYHSNFTHNALHDARWTKNAYQAIHKASS